jgi:hypothetical protein
MVLSNADRSALIAGLSATCGRLRADVLQKVAENEVCSNASSTGRSC